MYTTPDRSCVVLEPPRAKIHWYSTRDLSFLPNYYLTLAECIILKRNFADREAHFAQQPRRTYYVTGPSPSTNLT